MNWACRGHWSLRRSGWQNAERSKSRPTTRLFPGLAAEWNSRRPFVGALTLELPTDADDEVATWIAAGKPPIYFGFGSTPVQSPAETMAMIAEACAELGERALIYSDAAVRPPSHPDQVKLVGQVNYTAILPMCRAIVHHGGAGTTAAGLRAGIPTLILWDVADQPLWAATAARMKVSRTQRLSTITRSRWSHTYAKFSHSNTPPVPAKSPPE